MSLTLTLQNVEQLDNGQPTSLRLDRHGALIGRSPHLDWCLPDPKNYVSSTHCEIDYRDGGYVLIDKSTNGTFVNDGPTRLAGPHALKDGDVINIGHYRVAVGGAGVGAGGGGAAAQAPANGAASKGWGGWDDPAPAAGAAPAPSSGGWDTPAGSAPAAAAWGASPSASLPSPAPPSGGWDAPASTPAADPGGWASAPSAPAASAWSAQAAPAAAPAASSSWDAPSSAPAAAPWGAPEPAGAAASARGWDDAPSAPSAWSSPAPASPPADASPWGAVGSAGAAPAKPATSGWDALAPARDAGAGAGPGGSGGGWDDGAAPAPVSGRGALSGAWSPPRVDTPSAAAPPPAPGPDVWGAMAASNTVDWGRGGFGDSGWSASAAAPSPAPAGGDAAWAALLQAAGVDGAALKAEPAQAAATAGALLKRLVAGLVVMMEARARAKAQLGAQSTTLELKGNNPIKFARSPERVLAQMLNPPERGFMGATDAVEDSFRDLQAHQMATLAAMQGALRSTLDRFSPDSIRKRAETRGLLAKILPSARDAAMWQAYEREFEGVAKGSDEAFMDVFAKAFKAAYEQAAAQMKSQGG